MAKAKKESIKLKNYSPLRYLRGKGKLYPFVAEAIRKTGIQHPVYVEPFAGGAGVALSLLFNGIVQEIVTNDYDKAIDFMWKAILAQTKSFIRLIQDTLITVEEWCHQKRYI